MSKRSLGLDVATLEQELLNLRKLTAKEVEESWAEVNRLHQVCSSKDAIINDLQQQVQAQKAIIKRQQEGDEQPSLASTVGSNGASSSHHSRTIQVDPIAQDQHVQTMSMNDSSRSMFSIENLTDSMHRKFSLDRIASKVKRGTDEADISEQVQKEREEELEIKLKQREKAISNLEQALLNQTRMVKRLREELDKFNDGKDGETNKVSSDCSTKMVSYPSLLMRRAPKEESLNNN
mmetsp:Transcript_24411/g.37596  ORF Transcript_24411/g.37596 Transcript_24411/m.37596 type:complete len:235 (+) Transcript_24411:59-763(+)